MLNARHAAAVVLVLFFASGCVRLSPEEEQIIGTWEFTGLDATGRVVFRRDHKVIDLFPENDWAIDARWVPLSAGTWRLEGNEIVTDEQALPIPGYPPTERRTTRMRILEFHGDTLVRDENRSPFRRVISVAEIYTELLASLYVIASLVGLAVCIFGIRKTSLHTEFILLGIAALVALAYSSMLLIAELGQTGSLIISIGPLRAMNLPREVLKLVWILTVMIALARLAFSLRTRISKKRS